MAHKKARRDKTRRACNRSAAACLIVGCFFTLFIVFPGPRRSWELVSEARTSTPASSLTNISPLSNLPASSSEYPHPALGALGVPLHNPYIVLATMLFKQAEALPEWIEFHLLQGVDRFVIYHDSRTATPDKTREVVEPYIQEGIVEWVEWPADWAALEKAPHGPRTWFDKADGWSQWHFNDTLQNDCIRTRPERTHHLQAGCQKAAFIDVAARYRNRARWVGAWDVDEFVFGSKEGGEDEDGYDWEQHKLSTKMSELEHMDEVWLTGDIFGANGYFDDPIGPAPGLKFPLLTDLYHYRFAQENAVDLSSRPDVKPYAWSRKSLVDPTLVISNHIHGWETEVPESLNRESQKPTLHETRFHDIYLYHYQYRSLMGCHRKAVSNGNPAMEYNPVLQAYMDEKEDTGLAFMTPLVRDMLLHRMELGWWGDWVPPATGGPFTEVTETGIAPTVCLAFSHLDGNLARFRRSMASILHHLRTYEPSVVFESVAVAYASTNRRAFDEFPLDRIAYVPDTSSKAEAVHALFNLCTAPYAVSLVDGWETRVTWSGPSRQSVIKQIEKAVKSPVVGDAVRLLEARNDLLEVWIGDVPDLEQYWSNRTEWQETPWRGESAYRKRSSSSNSVHDEEKESVAVGDVGYFRTQSASDHGPRGISRLGGSVKHLGRRALVVSDPDKQSEENDKESTDNDGKQTTAIEEENGSYHNEQEGDERHSPVHKHDGSGDHRRHLPITHNMGRRRHGRRFFDPRMPPTSSDSSSKSFVQPPAYHDDDTEFASRAAALGFSSAHFCLGRDPESVHDRCDLDVDVLNDHAATGIMWRMRLVLEDPHAMEGMVDRAF